MSSSSDSLPAVAGSPGNTTPENVVVFGSVSIETGRDIAEQLDDLRLDSLRDLATHLGGIDEPAAERVTSVSAKHRRLLYAILLRLQSSGQATMDDYGVFFLVPPGRVASHTTDAGERLVLTPMGHAALKSWTSKTDRKRQIRWTPELPTSAQSPQWPSAHRPGV